MSQQPPPIKPKPKPNKMNKQKNTPIKIPLSSFSVGHSLPIMGPDLNSDLYTQ